MGMHFTIDELCRSTMAKAHGIDNTPPEWVAQNLRVTIAGCERVRAFLNRGHSRAVAMLISSGYRCEALNALVGGVGGSQHPRGEAVDFTAPAFGAPKEIVAALYPELEILGIDQLIYEGAWVHMSFTLYPRYQTLVFDSGAYKPYRPV